MLTHQQRIQTRKALASLKSLEETLEISLIRKTKLPLQEQEFIQNLTETSSKEEQFVAVREIFKETEMQYHAELLEMAPHDLTAYAEFMHPEEPPADHHIFFCEKLMRLDNGSSQRLMVSAPPGFAKSTYCSRDFPTWRIGRYPNTKYLQGGHSQNFVESEFGAKCRDIIDSERYRMVFPDVRIHPSSKAAGRWRTTTGASYLTRGVGQGIAGFRSNGGGIDDPFAQLEDAESDLIREKVYKWFKADFITRFLPKSFIFLIMTRWHIDDLAGRLEDENRQGLGIPWEIINLPALCDDPKNDPLGRKLGESLWPEFYTTESLNTLKAEIESNNPKIWSALYQGNPIDEIGGAVQRRWFQRYESLPKIEDRKRVTVSVDSANKDNERADYTVIQVWIEDILNHHYLAHVIRKKMEFTELERTINATAATWGASTILVEDKGSGTSYIQRQLDLKTKNAPCLVKAIQVDKNKQFRFDGCTPMIEGGQVYLPANKKTPWLVPYENELIAFPTGKYDDQVDATSQYLAWAKPRRAFGAKKIKGYSHSRASAKNEIEQDIARITALLQEKTLDAALEDGDFNPEDARKSIRMVRIR